MEGSNHHDDNHDNAFHVNDHDGYDHVNDDDLDDGGGADQMRTPLGRFS